MNEGTCQGIVLRVYQYSDTSLILHALTDRLGVVSVMAKGARKNQSAFAGKLDLFYLCQMELVLSKKSDLHILREVALLDSHPLLARNYDLLCGVSENVKIVERLVERGVAVPELFNLFCDYLKHLPEHVQPALGNVIFKIRLLALWGSLPQFAQMHLAEKQMALILALLEGNWDELVTVEAAALDVQFLEHVAEREIRNCQR